MLNSCFNKTQVHVQTSSALKSPHSLHRITLYNHKITKMSKLPSCWTEGWWCVCSSNRSAVHHTHANITHPAAGTLIYTHTGDVLSVLQCGALGALNENMLVVGCIRCLSTRGKGKKNDMLIQDLTVASSWKKGLWVPAQQVLSLALSPTVLTKASAEFYGVRWCL